MLQREFEYYLQHKDELIEQYRGKFVVIVGEEVKGAYDSDRAAVLAALESFEMGTFLVQRCLDQQHVHTFHSRVEI